MKILINALVFLSICLFVSLSSRAVAENSPSLKIALSQQITLADKALTVTFKQIEEDSRCPADAHCIWAGQATISIEVSAPDNPPAILTLTMPGGVPQLSPFAAISSDNKIVYAGYVIQLIGLEPYPHAKSTAEMSMPIATLKITKRESPSQDAKKPAESV